jgi:hypothetical protein
MDITPPDHDRLGDMMHSRVLLNPARVDVASLWPVHRIGLAWRPRKTEPTFLVVFRDAQQEVQFTEINAVTAHVLALLDSGRSGQQAFAQLAREMAHADPEALQGFGQELLIHLREQGVILGTLT